MDDCNEHKEAQLLTGSNVQIPLWTIVTFPPSSSRLSMVCSDSSMDDCNNIRLLSSSPVSGVQIPLWTIVTHL